MACRKFGTRSSARRFVVLVAAVFAGAGLAPSCMTHVAYPGRVQVVDFGQNWAYSEVELGQMRVRTDSGDELWLEASGESGPDGCSPVELRVLTAEGERVRPPYVLLSDRGAVSTRLDPERGAVLSADQLAEVVGWPPVRITADGMSAGVHDEQLFNFRQFVGELSCPTAE